MSEHLLLKWGTLKGWHIESDQSRAAFARYAEEPTSISAMTQHDTDSQKRALCDLIDAVDGEIINDWSGEVMTKEQAKTYVLEYGR